MSKEILNVELMCRATPLNLSGFAAVEATAQLAKGVSCPIKGTKVAIEIDPDTAGESEFTQAVRLASPDSCAVCKRKVGKRDYEVEY